ncbi:MAG: copper amine oxidase N-terminal domain-containing protein [Clostridium sp.]|nr:copper amine oxidase N-terminal domain-containing protein [Clostridium sp.]
MKKARILTLYFLIYSFLLNVMFVTTTFHSIASISTNVKVYIDGELMEFGLEANDPGPYIKEGRTLIPFRRIFEALDMNVSWDDKERMVTATGNDIEMKLYIGKTIAYVNSVEKTLDVPAEIADGRTFVPLRFVSENCGAEVKWDDSSKSVFITLPKEIALPDEDVPGAPGTIDKPVIEEKKLGEKVIYNGMTFSFDSVELLDTPDVREKKLRIKGTTNVKDSTLWLEVYDKYHAFVSVRAFAQSFHSDAYGFLATLYVSSSFTPSYMYVYADDDTGRRIKIAEYEF